MNNSKLNESVSAKLDDPEQLERISRRKFLGTAALLGLSGAGLATGLSSCKRKRGRRD